MCFNSYKLVQYLVIVEDGIKSLQVLFFMYKNTAGKQ